MVSHIHWNGYLRIFKRKFETNSLNCCRNSDKVTITTVDNHYRKRSVSSKTILSFVIPDNEGNPCPLGRIFPPTLAIDESIAHLEHGDTFDCGASFCSLYHPLGARTTSLFAYIRKGAPVAAWATSRQIQVQHIRKNCNKLIWRFC